MQEAETGLRHQRPSIVAHSRDGFRHPCWITRKKLVVFRCPQKTNNSQFDDKIVDDFLCLRFGENAFLEIPLEINIQKGIPS